MPTERDLEAAGGRGRCGAKKEIQGPSRRTRLSLTNYPEKLPPGFGWPKGAESELIPN